MVSRTYIGGDLHVATSPGPGLLLDMLPSALHQPPQEAAPAGRSFGRGQHWSDIRWSRLSSRFRAES